MKLPQLEVQRCARSVAQLLLAAAVGFTCHACLLLLCLHSFLSVPVAVRNKGRPCCCVHIEKQVVLFPGNPSSVPLTGHLS